MRSYVLEKILQLQIIQQSLVIYIFFSNLPDTIPQDTRKPERYTNFDHAKHDVMPVPAIQWNPKNTRKNMRKIC